MDVPNGSGIVGNEPADALQRVDAGAKSWLLKVRIHIEEGATLNLIGGTTGDANLLKLKSDVGTVVDADSGIVWIKALSSNLLIENTRVISFGAATGLPDARDVGVPGQGGGITPRAYIAARSDVAAGRTTTASTNSAQDGIHHGPVLR